MKYKRHLYKKKNMYVNKYKKDVCIHKNVEVKY